MRHDAIRNVYANAATISGDSDVWDADGNAVAIDESLIKAEVARLQAEQDATEYQRLRAPEYPPIGDQLDAILKHLNYRRTQGDDLVQGLDDIIGDWLSVKSKYPKD